MRGHRLCQADWMMRFYGYSAQELGSATDPGTVFRSTSIPSSLGRCGIAGFFPSMSTLRRENPRVPGLGGKAIDHIITSRCHRRLRLEDVARLTHSIVKLRPFLVACDWRPVALVDADGLLRALAPPRTQYGLFR